MSDLIQIQTGEPPWAPAPGTQTVEILHEYDQPLLAVIEQSGTRFMARCLLGEMSETNLWVYCRLDDHEDTVLREGTPEESDELAEYLSHGQVTVAMADQRGVIFSSRMDVPELPPMQSAAWISRELLNTLDRVRADALRIERVLVQ